MWLRVETDCPRDRGAAETGDAGLAADINADHNPMASSWTSVNCTGPVTSTGALDGLPTLHLESVNHCVSRAI